MLHSSMLTFHFHSAFLSRWATREGWQQGGKLKNKVGKTIRLKNPSDVYLEVIETVHIVHQVDGSRGAYIKGILCI